jgi:hypothetical protein
MLALRERLLEPAARRRRFGYQRLYLLRRREGHLVSHKRAYRLYKAAGLCVRKHSRKRASRSASAEPNSRIGRPTRIQATSSQRLLGA